MRRIAILMGMIMILVGTFIVNFLDTYAAEEKKILTGKVYDLGEKDKYEINKAESVSDKASRFI